MEIEQISRTAQMTAYGRGYHSRNDSTLIFDDFLAFDLLGCKEQHSIEEQLMGVLRDSNPVAAASFSDKESTLCWMMQSGAAPPIVLSRASYAEELLDKAMERGVRQYVLLGAGLDTYAFRCADRLKELCVFELDHPGTQGYKRRRLDELRWELSSNLHFIPVDFTRTGLLDVLRSSEFDPQVPTFFSWLGVTYYLSRFEVMSTLHDIARIAAPGSSIVFDYLDGEAFSPVKCTPRVQRMINHVESLEEPMLPGFEPFTLAEELKMVGFGLLENLCPWDIQNRWFMGRTDHYRACEHAHFAHAVVG